MNTIHSQTTRLDKYLSSVGICSRRNVEKMLIQDEVTVNGIRVYTPRFRINPETDLIKRNGKRIQQPTLVYYLLNKPKGYITTTSDEYKRDNVISLINSSERIFPVGRLDKDTTGLLLLTNDGDLTNYLTHPRYHIGKKYRLTLLGEIHDSKVSLLKNGVQLEDGLTQPAEVVIQQRGDNKTILDMVIHQGKNRQIRRMCQALGLNLLELERIQIGSITKGSLKSGKSRELTSLEIKTLKQGMAKSRQLHQE